MATISEWSALTDDRLLEAYRNCRTTYYRALGHNKAERNRGRLEELRRELHRRKLSIPGDDDVGIFNGRGSL